jgi:hypothetical protein
MRKRQVPKIDSFETNNNHHCLFSIETPRDRQQTPISVQMRKSKHTRDRHIVLNFIL